MACVHGYNDLLSARSNYDPVRCLGRHLHRQDFRDRFDETSWITKPELPGDQKCFRLRIHDDDLHLIGSVEAIDGIGQRDILELGKIVAA